MKFTIGNLGKVKEANLELGDLTIICGPNNIGKTYIAYSIYAFLSTIGFNLRIQLKDTDFKEIVKSGICQINLEEYWTEYKKSIKKLVPLFVQNIPRFLAISDKERNDTYFEVFDVEDNINRFINHKIVYGFAIGLKNRVIFQKEAKSNILTCTLNNESEDFPEEEKLKERLSYYFSNILNQNIFPNIQGMTGERSGISLFGTYLRQLSSDQIKQEYLKHRGGGAGTSYLYPKPVIDEIDLFLNLNTITLSQSFFTLKSPNNTKLIKLFKLLAGGIYEYKNNIITYKPDDGDKPLFLQEVSSSVKALIGLNFYLKHQARPGHILMIDEPELNLHPKNQRNMARLLAMLVNAGIKVFITTHSDYIIREFNTLIQLNNDDAYLKKLQKQEGYAASELLDARKVRAYVAEKQEDGVTLKAAPITQKDGITIDTLDEVIDKMNQIQDKIIWRE